MPNDRLRRQIAFEAARLIYGRRESDYQQAKLRASRRLAGGGGVQPSDLPSNRQVREQIESLDRRHRANWPDNPLDRRRLAALQVMRVLYRFRPRLVDSTLTGLAELDEHEKPDGPSKLGQAVEIDLFGDSLAAITDIMDHLHWQYEVVPGEASSGGSILVHGLVEFELRLFASPQAARRSRESKSSQSGDSPHGATIAELTELIALAHPHRPPDDTPSAALKQPDRFRVYRDLLLPLEQVKQSLKRHPEGDALYHSLQVFELASRERPYDEEFLLAALLHDVGKAIDPYNHLQAGLEALGDSITERTAWLIENQPAGAAAADGTLGARARRRLQAAEDYDELMLLVTCDRGGRVRGGAAPELDEALVYIRDLAETCGD